MSDHASREDPGEYTSRQLLREVVLTGVAVVVPVLVSVYVLTVSAGFLAGFLTPIAKYLPGNTGLIRHVLAALVVGLAVLVVGLVAHFRTGERALDYFDAVMGRIPGIGTVYRSFRRMSDVMLEGDANHFREVKLVPFPDEGIYSLGFETAATPESITSPTGGEPMRTLFVPMGPNPFMGGYILHVPERRLIDVDLTVEEGIRATVTSGVALGADDLEGFEGPAWELSDFERVPDMSDLRDLRIESDAIRDFDSESFDAERLRQVQRELRELELDEIEDRLLGRERVGTGRSSSSDESTDGEREGHETVEERNGEASDETVEERNDAASDETTDERNGEARGDGA